jgi:hypothetical protein
MSAQEVSLFWYIAVFIVGIGVAISGMHFIAWVQEKRNPPNELEWLDKHMNRDHFFEDPNNKGVTLKGKLIDINPAKGNRAKGKPNYEFIFQVGRVKYTVAVNSKWRLV